MFLCRDLQSVKWQRFSSCIRWPKNLYQVFFHTINSAGGLCSTQEVVITCSCRSAVLLRILRLSQCTYLMGLITSTDYYTGRNAYHRKVRTRKLILVDFMSQNHKSNWLRHVTRMKNRMPKVLILNCGPNGRRQLGRPLKRLLDETETGPLSLTRDG